MVYLVPPELAVAAESGVVRQLQYSPDGTIISTGGAAPAVISKVRGDLGGGQQMGAAERRGMP